MLAAPRGTVHACTDITGFGLAGHASEMAAASGVTIELEAAALPFFGGVADIAMANQSGGMSSNRSHFGSMVAAEGLDARVDTLIYDPQTSGGLLIAVDPRAAAGLQAAIAAAAGRCARVGRAVALRPGRRVLMV
jgi:selenide,water dikinase